MRVALVKNGLVENVCAGTVERVREVFRNQYDEYIDVSEDADAEPGGRYDATAKKFERAPLRGDVPTTDPVEARIAKLKADVEAVKKKTESGVTKSGV